MGSEERIPTETLESEIPWLRRCVRLRARSSFFACSVGRSLSAALNFTSSSKGLYCGVTTSSLTV